MLEMDDVCMLSVNDKQFNYNEINASKYANCFTVPLTTIC